LGYFGFRDVKGVSMSELERFRGCYVKVKRDEFRPRTYRIYFEGGLGQMRGANNPSPRVPSPPEAEVEIVEGAASVYWRIPPKSDEDLFTEKTREVALREHQKSENES
jgi:hypothetical protein